MPPDEVALNSVLASEPMFTREVGLGRVRRGVGGNQKRMATIHMGNCHFLKIAISDKMLVNKRDSLRYCVNFLQLFPGVPFLDSARSAKGKQLRRRCSCCSQLFRNGVFFVQEWVRAWLSGMSK